MVHLMHQTCFYMRKNTCIVNNCDVSLIGCIIRAAKDMTWTNARRKRILQQYLLNVHSRHRSRFRITTSRHLIKPNYDCDRFLKIKRCPFFQSIPFQPYKRTRLKITFSYQIKCSISKIRVLTFIFFLTFIFENFLFVWNEL